LRQRQVGDLGVVGGGVGAGVARPQQASERLAGAVLAVQEGQQRVEPEAALVGAGGGLLVGMRLHQRAVDVDQQQPVGVRAGLPGPRAGLGPGRPQPGQAEFVTGDALDDPPGGGGRGDRAEQLTLVTQHR
jgi:hypothetical protein